LEIFKQKSDRFLPATCKRGSTGGKESESDDYTGDFERGMPDRTQKIIENNWTTIGQEEKSVCIDAINLSNEEDNTHRYLCITPIQPRI
jgi:hypothetical protein